VNLGLPAPPTSARTKRTHPKQDHQTLLPHPIKHPTAPAPAVARRGDGAKDTSGLKPLRNPELDAAPPRGGAARSGGRLVVSRRRAAGGCLFLPPPCAALRTRQNRRGAVLPTQSATFFGGWFAGDQGVMADQLEGSSGHSQRIFLGCVDERHGQPDGFASTGPPCSGWVGPLDAGSRPRVQLWAVGTWASRFKTWI